jgi:hypothetical protein
MDRATMPLVYLGIGWFIGIALASALHLRFIFCSPHFWFRSAASSSGAMIGARLI